jgi:hypothetical protein
MHPPPLLHLQTMKWAQSRNMAHLICMRCYRLSLACALRKSGFSLAFAMRRNSFFLWLVNLGSLLPVRSVCNTLSIQCFLAFCIDKKRTAELTVCRNIQVSFEIDGCCGFVLHPKQRHDVFHRSEVVRHVKSPNLRIKTHHPRWS